MDVFLLLGLRQILLFGLYRSPDQFLQEHTVHKAAVCYPVMQAAFFHALPPGRSAGSVSPNSRQIGKINLNISDA